MKLRLPKRRLYRVLLYILSIDLIFTAADLILVRVGRHVSIAPDTTFITSPLKPNGYPDYSRHIDTRFSEGVTPDNNAAPLLLAAFDPSTLPPEVRNETYTAVHQSPPSNNSTLFIYYADFLHNKNLPTGDVASHHDDINKAMNKYWTSTDYPLLAQYLQSQQPALDRLHVAAARPRYYFPLVAPAAPPFDDLMINYFVATLTPTQQLARAALARATLRAGTGDFAGAHTDLLDVHRLARLLAQQPTFIEFIAAVSIDSQASVEDALLATSGKLSAQQARDFLADLAGLPAMPSPENAFSYGERLFCLDCYMFASRVGISKIFAIVVPSSSALLDHLADFYPVDFDVALRELNQSWDDVLAAFELPTFRERQAALRALPREINIRARNDFIPHPAHCLLATLTPSLVKASGRIETQKACTDLARLTLALALYHADHHAYPDFLSALTPDYLPVIPNDRFNDQPLHYAGKKLDYLLYSVGPNMTDDGALLTSDDIIFSPSLPAPTLPGFDPPP